MEQNSLIKELNDSQLAAILYNEGPSIIVAGAGVGKTKVLTHKIAYLITGLNVSSERILAVTFTNKAAKEMKNRVSQLLNNDRNNVRIFTYHGLCAQILRRESQNLNINNNYNIIDTSDQRQILRDIYQRDFNHKPEASEIKMLIHFISEWKNHHLTKEDVIHDYTEQETWVLRAKVYERYQEYQRQNNCLDFDDLLLLVAQLFKEFPNIASKWQNKFDFVLVDEFQDTNNLQYEILLNLVSKKQNLTIVGDPDQTIYTWRGANINLILKFTEKFPQAETFILNQNYRSTSKILNVANSLITNNEQRIAKNLFTKNNLGEDIIVYHAVNSTQEANWVANVIKKISLKENIKLNQIAVLYRNNYLSKDLEQAFINHNLNYRIVGGFKFFERKEIKDIIAYLKVIAWNDNLSMIRILNATPKIGAKTIEGLLSQANENNLTLSEYLFLFQHNLTKNHKLYLQPLINLITDFKEKTNEVTSLHQMVSKLLQDTEYLKKLKDQFENERIENIKQFLEQIVEFDSKNENLQGELLLTTFLQEISLYTDLDEDNDIEAINFMTIHSAKGLEFEVVFIIGLNEGILPGLTNPTINLSTKEKIKLEEERRLFYVAITRAKRFLFVSSASGYSYVLNNHRVPSRFFEELDFQYLKVISSNRTQEENQEKFYPKNYKFNKIVSRINSKELNQSTNSENPWKISDLLTHEIFGSGVVTKIIGDKIEVAFHKKTGGIKILSASHPLIKKVI
ncbi:ATP-dependent helicase [Spiroplasma platyhelix]|uniref:DNA 3'-5' helicase n=1 Tax=Spiroplasma platyhelix PALS-1 TaxID=1276218 RepID=A0A846TVL7_9MOLU|nr:UvrD-helicase domain-containing protein [Spiroplasma platyhelix]MBE4703819.1 ATP-dependent DNA helicase PcrA [Spiroplasma platyhelix PALS-1]NKE38192.1 UvrD-helicase domain-containing protein [Spiroplasma platyhelix PALS-1]UJB29077.1 ATP-dependent DNA helicase [Spiroplasma platyhelix PALS-1]